MRVWQGPDTWAQVKEWRESAHQTVMGFGLCPQEGMLKSLPLSPKNRALFGNGVLADVVRVRSDWPRGALNPV